MIDLGRHPLAGVLVDAVDYEAAVEKLIAAAHAAKPFAASALAVHGVMTGALDREHRYRLNHLDLVVPDGQPVRWALNWLHRASLNDRVYGPTLMIKVCQRAADEGLPIYLFGGTSDLLRKLQLNLQTAIPGLIIAGTMPSKFRRLQPGEGQDIAQTIRYSGARIVMVGLGCPRQEVWAFENREALSIPILAVGAAFNFHAGTLPQAPEWLQRRGLEWLFRLVQEPTRLWRRYLLLNPAYLAMLFLQWTGLKRFDPTNNDPPSRELSYG